MLWSTVLSKIVSARGACLWGLGEVARDLSGGLAGPSGSCSSSSAMPLILGTPAGVACGFVGSSPAGKLFCDRNPHRNWQSATTAGTLSCPCNTCVTAAPRLLCLLHMRDFLHQVCFFAPHALLSAGAAQLVATCQHIANATHL